jgi:hypothetical protein
VAISHSEKVGPPVLSQMWQYQKRILVHLVWIFGRIPSLCCKCKLGNTIIKLFTGLPRLHSLKRRGRCNLLGDRRSDIMWSGPLFLVFLARRIPVLGMCPT